MNSSRATNSSRTAPWATTHGHTKGGVSPTYRSWMSMKARVRAKGKEHVCYRGVKICYRWREFANFLADMGVRPAGTSLDRLDSSKGYQPDNCRWATPKQQGENRAVVQPITHNGKTQNAEDWARELNIKPQTLRRRLSRGWPVEHALSPKVLKHGYHAPWRQK